MLQTVWDAAADEAPHPYDVVATRLRDVVRSALISDIYRTSTKEDRFGSETTHSLDALTQEPLAWSHFYTGALPRHISVAQPDTARGDYRTTAQVFERGLLELTPEAVDTVLSLIESNNLYRGEEHRGAVLHFQAAQRAYLSTESDWARNVFVWTSATGPAARFRNTALGKLVQDLSEGKDVEHAVRAFETMVASANYKRPSPVITPAMVRRAMETVAELGLEPALERRLARIEDVSVRDVLWVDGSVRPLMRGGLREALLKHAAATSPRGANTDEERADDITLDRFVGTVLPEATGVELFLKGSHLGNLMVLTAPVHPEPRQLFRWKNDFAWAYAGNVTDSIAERVKMAGGKVEGAALRVSLSWFNTDDLDIHVREPSRYGHSRIYFGNRRGLTGGELDVDMNVTRPVRGAVENVAWMKAAPNGAYEVVVNNFQQREVSDPGFVVEVESCGKLSHYSYSKVVHDKHSVHVATLHMRSGAIERVDAGDPAVVASDISRERWGLKTETYVKVSAVTLSPNYWGDDADDASASQGNKHTFFVLDGAQCDEPMRGIFNEYLHPRLEAHRKVFEVIGDKTKCAPAPGALAGVGFSSTKKDSFVARVQQGRRQRLFNVRVGQ